MVVISQNSVEVVCKKCGADVQLNLTPGNDMLTILETPPKRLVIKKPKTLDSEKPKP
jgi:hypothetical protein